jgi:hypothetical protein
MLLKQLRKVDDGPRGSGPDLVLGRAPIKDYSNSRVLERIFMYERRIEHSLFKTIAELHKLRLMRKQEDADVAEEQSAPETCPTVDNKADNKKQSQFLYRQPGSSFIMASVIWSFSGSN